MNSCSSNFKRIGPRARTLQVKKQEKTIKRLRQLLRAKAAENSQLSAKVLNLEIAESGDEEEEETEDGVSSANHTEEYMEGN